jgi:Galactose-3-O-sulfotransferase
MLRFVVPSANRNDRTFGPAPLTPQTDVQRSDDPTVIFLHIGKTGGMTLRSILGRQFAASQIMVLRTPDRAPSNHRLRREETIRHFAAMPEPMRRRPRLIEGHTIFGLHEYVPGPSTYITLVRDPVALTASQYNFVARKPGHWLHDELRSSGMTLDEYVDSGLSLETDNSQTRALSGDTSTAFGRCSQEMLERAKSNVDEHFSVLGLTERFDETLLLLRRAFGWSRLWYVPANVAPHRRRGALSSETLGRIAERNRFDVELYRWACERFQRTIGDPSSFATELRAFRRANALYRPWGHATQTIPKRLYVRWKSPAQTAGGP